MEKAGGFLKRKGMERWRKAGPEQYSTTGRSRVRVRGDGVLLPGRLASSALGAKTRRKAEEARPLDWIGRVLPQPPGSPVPAPTLWRTLARLCNRGAHRRVCFGGFRDFVLVALDNHCYRRSQGYSDLLGLLLSSILFEWCKYHRLT
jgi:hypothetical protein